MVPEVMGCLPGDGIAADHDSGVVVPADFSGKFFHHGDEIPAIQLIPAVADCRGSQGWYGWRQMVIVSGQVHEKVDFIPLFPSPYRRLISVPQYNLSDKLPH